MEFAKRRGVTSEVRKIEGWLNKLGKRIVGGTAIGKYYDTLILDISYQGGEIDFDMSSGRVKLYNTTVSSYKEFKEVYERNKR